MIAIYKHDLINVLRKVKEQCDTDYVAKSSGQGLSSNDFTTAEKEKLAALPDTIDLSIYVEKEAGKGLSTNDYTTEEKSKLAAVPTPATIAVLDANNKIPFANLPPEFTAIETVAAFSNLPTTGNYEGRRVLVLDASGDPTVTTGFAVYIYNLTTDSWIKILEGESMDVSAITDWTNIQNVPSDLLHETDIVDALNSTSTTDALSANQGKELKTLVDSKVSSVAEGSTNGTVKVNGTTDVPVHGLGTAAYTASTDYAASSHTHTAVNGYTISVVSALPASPDSDTIYFVLEQV